MDLGETRRLIKARVQVPADCMTLRDPDRTVRAEHFFRSVT